ncbi:MAG: bifunctional DNA-formamidopyrimidine glycosylase/DNA-(apurinic or apyrimidinic site) lyase [Hyphomicrobiales bacterium]|nr:bifunctional DNA-formamidopyrimidine glycosylase/DNA-(apurinic or apyrimidinic site) lyase [Hyphomicrobiales bacterium]MBV8426377.1 bifunctional DNA-formamidopyrimidine glycosylase/DNA-(apurinic or apyrimidinic site) lyase [Hyphomicrobiales bacterium]
MPELPEVETIRRGLAPALEGASFTKVELRRRDLRFPFPRGFAKRLEGAEVTALGRRAKYLVGELDSGDVLVIHLGMTGRFVVEESADGPKRRFEPGRFYDDTERIAAHDHVVFHLSTGKRVIYNDARRFGFMTLVKRDELDAHPLFHGLGIEPIGNEFGAEALVGLFAGKTRPLKSALLDQRLIAGLGNIYVSEALFRAELSPRRAANTLAGKGALARARREALAEAIRRVLAEAIEKGGSTLRDYAKADGERGAFQHEFRAYGREGEACLRAGCRGTIARLVQSGRSTFFCRICQK